VFYSFFLEFYLFLSLGKMILMK